MVPPVMTSFWSEGSALSSGTFLVATISILVPAAIAGAIYCEQRRAKEQELPSSQCRGGTTTRKKDAATTIHDEPCCPNLEVKPWQEACHLHGCPWNFEGCECFEDVLQRIWRQPLSKDLHQAFEALRASVRGVQVVRSSIQAAEEMHYAIVYTLVTGGRLFGGAPVEHAVGVVFVDETCELGRGTTPPEMSKKGLRRRRGASSPRSPVAEGPDLSLLCLDPFYRIHNGFGVLLSPSHLPLLLSSPSEHVHGSCFYVYPISGFERVRGLRSNLVKFARVDRRCSVYADSSVEQPHVVYVETNGNEVEDDEAPLAFVVDTVCTIAGQRSGLLAY